MAGWFPRAKIAQLHADLALDDVSTFAPVYWQDCKHMLKQSTIFTFRTTSNTMCQEQKIHIYDQ